MSDPVLHQALFYDYVAYYPQRRGPFRTAHLAHAKKWKDTGLLISAGTLGTPPTGALFDFIVDDPAELDNFVTTDPYVLNGIVAGHRIVPWTVVI